MAQHALISKLLANSGDWQAGYEKYLNDQPYYAASYSVYMDYFRRNLNDTKTSVAATKLAYVSSWLAHIYKSNLELGGFVNISSNWKNVCIDSLVSVTNTANVRKFELKDCTIDFDELHVSLRGFLDLRSTDGIPTISKFLHFQYPYFFPILDSNIKSSLGFHTSIPGYVRYIQSIWQTSQEMPKEWLAFTKFFKRHGISPLRALDCMYF